VEVDRLSEEGEWQPQNPSLNTPPFRLHLIALLLCLHLQLVSEARERQIPLQQVLADLSVSVSNSWDLEAVVASLLSVLRFSSFSLVPLSPVFLP
jgi:hypothetical protein